MSAREARAGEFVTSTCRARRLLCNVDLPVDIGRGMWTVTERGPGFGNKDKSNY